MSRTERNYPGHREDYLHGFDPERDGIDWLPKGAKKVVKRESNRLNRREWLYETERKKFNARLRFISY